jgi:ubiquinone/menaquinone biosynthesis C-methylase UbiE
MICKMTKVGKEAGIAAAYDRWAETYDTDPNRTRELAGEVLRQVELPIAGSDIVEIGCGTGLNTEWLATQAASVTALDFSEKMLRQAAARVQNPRACLIQHDVCKPWPLANDAADVIVAMLILEHVEHLQLVFAEAARVLRPNGQLFICELHPMRQLMGGQAQFSNTQTGERELVAAFLHNVSDFVNVGLAAGFELAHLDEWRDAGAPSQELPRLLSLTFRLPVPG